jgi:hypothetical protein
VKVTGNNFIQNITRVSPKNKRNKRKIFCYFFLEEVKRKTKSLGT